MNKEASHYVRLFGGSKIGNLTFWLPIIDSYNLTNISECFLLFHIPRTAYSDFVKHKDDGGKLRSSISYYIPVYVASCPRRLELRVLCAPQETGFKRSKRSVNQAHVQNWILRTIQNSGAVSSTQTRNRFLSSHDYFIFPRGMNGIFSMLWREKPFIMKSGKFLTVT